MIRPSLRNVLTVRAGARARRVLMEHGFRPELFTSVIGASGGPKWLSLYGIDQVLARRFFPGRRPIALLGSSAGAWRHACLAQRQPEAAVDRFLEAYLEQRYSRSPTPGEVSHQAALILDHVLGPTGAADIVARQDLLTHVLTVRCRGLCAREPKLPQTLGLGLAASMNALSRRTLGLHFERVLFHTGSAPAISLHGLPGQAQACTERNLHAVLMASGAIPLVLAGVSDIPDAPPGTYRDGGMTDYHFDFRMSRPEGLCLFPHYSASIIPGWFDKGLPWRRIRGPRLEDVVLLAPAPELVAGLPYGKVPDRRDFSRIGHAERLAYWRKAVDESRRLGDALFELLDAPDLSPHLEPL